uniref:Uncharacterized protein n=1 Tax=Tetranychus urticae TaxID=32264 RepID=T1KQF6_TETUR
MNFCLEEPKFLVISGKHQILQCYFTFKSAINTKQQQNEDYCNHLDDYLLYPVYNVACHPSW